MYAEHYDIMRNRMGLGVGADAYPPLMLRGHAGSKDGYTQLSERLGGQPVLVYTGPLPPPQPGQPLVPPHLTKQDMAELEARMAKGERLSPLANSLYNYAKAFYVKGQTTGARPDGGSTFDKLMDKAKGLFDGGKKALGMGDDEATGYTPTQQQASGGFLEWVLSPVGIVLSVVVVGGTTYYLTRKKKG